VCVFDVSSISCSFSFAGEKNGRIISEWSAQSPSLAPFALSHSFAPALLDLKKNRIILTSLQMMSLSDLMKEEMLDVDFKAIWISNNKENEVALHRFSPLG
jgi:hypothetical protein